MNLAVPLLVLAVVAGPALAQPVAPAAGGGGAKAVPPQVIVSYPPAALVRVDGTPSLAPVPGHPRVQRVRNTRALILFAAKPDSAYLSDRSVDEAYYLRASDGWLTSTGIAGPWKPVDLVPFLRRQLDAIASSLEGTPGFEPVAVEVAPGRPAARVFVTESPAELVVFTGPPRYEPIPGTRLTRAANADRMLVMDPATRTLYLRSGPQWLAAPHLDGPWRVAPAEALPADLAKLPAR